MHSDDRRRACQLHSLAAQAETAKRVRWKSSMSHAQAIERVVDLTDPARNVIFNMTIEEARRLVASGDAAAVRRIDGDFALVATAGVHVLMARSIGRPLRYFIAKRSEGPALIAADRIDAIYGYLKAARAGRPVPSLLHAHGPGPPRHRRGPRRLPRPEPDLHPLLRPAPQRPAGRPRRHRPGLHRRRPATRLPSGCVCGRRTARSASASPAASTAAPSSSSSITPCCGSA